MLGFLYTVQQLRLTWNLMWMLVLSLILLIKKLKYNFTILHHRRIIIVQFSIELHILAEEWDHLYDCHSVLSDFVSSEL